MRNKILLSAAVGGGLAIAALSAQPAFAVHEANNKFDMAIVAGAPDDADATGRSNFAAGNNGWDNAIRATGLEADTAYTWVGIAGNPPTASEICSFTTDADGAGDCTSDVNSRLGATELREGGVDGETVLRATASTDNGSKVDDGEIERRGTERFKG